VTLLLSSAQDQQVTRILQQVETMEKPQIEEVEMETLRHGRPSHSLQGNRSYGLDSSWILTLDWTIFVLKTPEMQLNRE
jgi:hypothetical protein